MKTPPRNPLLAAFHQHWREIAADKLPDRSRVRFDLLLPLMSLASLIDVRPENPADYIIVFQGDAMPRNLLYPRRRVGEVRSTPLREALMFDYRFVKQNRKPMYYRIAIIVEGLPSTGVRLLLPFSENGRDVHEILCLSQAEPAPDLFAQLLPKTGNVYDEPLPPDPRGF